MNTPHQLPLIGLGWDDYSAMAPYSSEHWASSDRGWLFVEGFESSLGNYLDYGPDHYRSPHDYCQDGKCTCALSFPGSVHAVRYPKAKPGNEWSFVHGPCEARYFPTVEQAKAWIEEPFKKVGAR